MREREREEVRTTNEHAAAADPAAEAGMTNEQAKKVSVVGNKYSARQERA